MEFAFPGVFLYSQYLEFCREMSYRPACSATFGKVTYHDFLNCKSARIVFNFLQHADYSPEISERYYPSARNKGKFQVSVLLTM